VKQLMSKNMTTSATVPQVPVEVEVSCIVS